MRGVEASIRNRIISTAVFGITRLDSVFTERSRCYSNLTFMPGLFHTKPLFPYSKCRTAFTPPTPASPALYTAVRLPSGALGMKRTRVFPFFLSFFYIIGLCVRKSPRLLVINSMDASLGLSQTNEFGNRYVQGRKIEISKGPGFLG